MTKILLAGALAFALVSCDQMVDEAAPDMGTKAMELAKSSITIDGHIDVPYRLERVWEDIGQATEAGNFDYSRATAGGLNAPFMSIYTPASLEAEGRSKEVADSLIDLVERIVAENPGKFSIATSVAEVREQFAAGIISLPLGMENGSPIDGDLANLRHFYDRGIRYMTLTHSLSNHISDSSYDDNKNWGGLSPFGEEVVGEMNRLGIMVDISHVSDDAFYDVMELTAVPVIASHSSLRHFTPGFERNMSDDMVRLLGENGGVIMINYGSAFLTEIANAYNGPQREASAAYFEAAGIDEPSREQQQEFAISYREEFPYPFARLDDVLDHIDRVVDLVGIEHVGIGSDYDGVGDSLPIGLKDVSSYPNLIAGLLERGYSDGDIQRILGENLLRVWSEVEAYAAEVR